MIICWKFFFSICAIINATSYILALIVTIEYWKVDRLNAKTSSMLAQIFPYIGYYKNIFIMICT